ncbi:MAG TPA: tetratricopeptide repeat protein [Kofleriaceae bacterium]|nr:tetratricopeptide repeat protein [Kofleriaceae bacterium]
MERQIQVMLAQADQYMRLANWRGAIDLCRSALTIDPDHAQAHALLALALLGAKRLAGAEIESRLALTSDPDLALAHYAAASVLFARRKLDDAWAHCLIALQANTHDVDAHVLGASIRDLRGEPGAARELLEQALAIEPAHTDALVRFARLELDAHRYDLAARYADEALRTKPEDIGAHVIAGFVELVRGDDARAEEHARFALNQDSTDRSALHLWAAIKAHRSWTLGLWWRLNTWVSLRSERGQIAMLIGSFVVVQLAIILSGAVGLPMLERFLRWSWLGFCAYTWFAPELFKRWLANDLGKVTLDPDY